MTPTPSRHLAVSPAHYAMLARVRPYYVRLLILAHQVQTMRYRGRLLVRLDRAGGGTQ